MDNSMLLRERLALSYTKRWIINPTLRESNVAEHTFRVLAIALYLLEWCRASNPRHRIDTLHLILDVIDHDREECHTGDIPSTGKHITGEVPMVEDMVVRLRKVADSIETYSFWVHWGNHEIGGLMHDPLHNPQGQWETKRILAYTDGWPELRQGAAQVLRILQCRMPGVTE